MTHNVYLPFIAHNTTPKPVLSTYLENVTASRMAYAVPGQHIAWGVKWSEVEKVRGVYDWSLYDGQHANIGEYPHRITVKMTPEWARIEERKEFACAPMKPEYYWHFGNFVLEVILRYKPYAIELWNEPDVDPRIMIPSHTDYYGGWGGMSREYADFTVWTYKSVKVPGVTIMAGALMLIGEDQWQFAADLIEYGQFDVLSFHNYSHGRLYDMPFEKADRLRTMTDKPLWLSETAYQTTELYDDFEWEQAHYLEHLVEGAKAHDIEYICWYTLAQNGWRNTDLVMDGHKKLAWYSFEKLIGGDV